MSSTLIKKLTLVGPGGLAYGHYPKGDETKTQLQSGFISAMLNFSQEVHHSNLESMTLHDRTMSFVQLSNNFFLIAEFSNSLDKLLMRKIISQMKEELDDALDNFSSGSIPSALGDQLLVDLASQEWMDKVLNSIGLDKPLKSAIIGVKSNDRISMELDKVISKFENFTAPFLLPLEKEEVCLYAVPLEDTIHYLKLPFSAKTKLFRMAPLLSREAKYMRDMEIDPQLKMNRLKDMPDLGFNITQEVQDLISFPFLLENAKKRLDRGIAALIEGKPVLVVGERVSVRIVTLTLQIFTQHIHTEVIEWLDEEATEIPNGTTGLSVQKYKQLEDIGNIPEDLVVFQLYNRRIIGGRDNKYVQNLIKKLEKQKKPITTVRDELDTIVESALQVTELLTLPTEEAKKSLSELKIEVGDNSKFNLIMSLSSQRNPALETLVSDLSETLKRAESFLGEF